MPPQDEHKNLKPSNDGDLYGVSGPCESSVNTELAAEYMRKAAVKKVIEAVKPPPRPEWPMVSGVFTFPFYPKTLAVWLFISIGMVVTGWLLILLLTYGVMLQLWGARLFGLPVCLSGLLTFSYAFTCCLTVIEDTFNGWDAVEDWPDMNWKEWVWSFARVVAFVLQAGLVGLALDWAVGADSWLPGLVGTLAAFPFVVLGSLAADGAWVPLAIGRVVVSLPRLWWAWILFYVETTPLVFVWILLTGVGLLISPWLTPFYSGPLLAAVMLIYARLLGRLALLIGEEEDEEE